MPDEIARKKRNGRHARTAIRTFRALALALGLAWATALSGCAGAWGGRMSADEAFALSASALSGTDRYRFEGEVAVVLSGGWTAGRASFDGEVSGHGNRSLQWKGEAASRQGGGESSLHPVKLLDYIKSNSASMTYDPAMEAANSDTVRIRIELDPDAARRRIADSLRSELAGLRDEPGLLPADPRQRAIADAKLADAEAALDEAIGTLRVSTVCVLDSRRKSWFPSRLKEETVLEYTWKGQQHREQRDADTRFVRGAERSSP